MRGQQEFTDEFKRNVVSEYRQGIFGYKKLAKKYSIDRDRVRRWVLQTPITIEEAMKKDKPLEFTSIEEEVQYLRDAAMYWKTYAEILAREVPLDKKKACELKGLRHAPRKEQK